MAESVDALVSNTSGAIRAGSTPALGTQGRCIPPYCLTKGQAEDLKITLSTRSPVNRERVTEKEVYAMIVVPVKEGENIERAIKKFKRKFDKTGVIKELRRRQQFNKPSEVKRVKMAHAKYVQSLHAHDDM